VDTERLLREFGRSAPEIRLARRIESGQVAREGERIRLEGEGWLLLDAIAAELSG
jgi:hypothetical protein